MSVSDNPVTLHSGFPYLSNDSQKWDNENIDLLQTLVAQKLSALEIANAMTRKTIFSYTRNAIIGKVRRLGLALLGGDNKPHPIIVKPPKKRNPVAIALKPRILPKSPTIEEVVANPKRLTILEMQRGQCYWPTSLAFDQPSHEIRFCGHATHDNEATWCPAHQKIGYTQPHQRAGWGYR
jgi:GcrA cell cycle regulator